MRRLLSIAFVLLCSSALFGQGAVTTTLQVQNSGSTVYTRSGFIRMNFTAGCTASVVSGSLNLACTGSANNPGGTANQIQWNSAGTSFAGFTMSGDCTIVVATGVITCTKTSGSAFAPSATTDATNATNIGSGTLNAARLPATAVLTNQANTFSTGLQNMSAADYLQPVHVSDPATCTAGQIEFNSTSAAMKVCTATNTWTALGAGGGGGTTTNALTMNNSNSGAASGTTFDGSVARTISTNSIGAPNLGTANTFGAFLQDFSASTIKLPFGAGFTTTANGNMGYDTTGLNWKLWQNGADRIAGVINGSTTNGDCSKFVVSGSTVSLQDAGVGCGPISVSQMWLPSGTPNELPVSPAAQTGQGVNTVGCIQFVPTDGITATKISVAVNTVSIGQTVNVGIYDNSLNLVRDSGAFSCGVGGGVGLSNTVSSFTLNAGSTYYACAAFTDGTCAIQGLAPAAGYANIANKNATRNFTCANALSAGAMPGSCGAQTPVTGKEYIILLEQ